jgi:hypothetical protein
MMSLLSLSSDSILAERVAQQEWDVPPSINRVVQPNPLNVGYYASASPFSDTSLCIHRDTEFSRLKLSISNLLFLRVPFNPSVACDRF